MNRERVEGGGGVVGGHFLDKLLSPNRSFDSNSLAESTDLPRPLQRQRQLNDGAQEGLPRVVRDEASRIGEEKDDVERRRNVEEERRESGKRGEGGNERNALGLGLS